jgi:hypothetical protein
MKYLATAWGILWGMGFLLAQQPPGPAQGPRTLEAVQAEIEALRDDRVAWRELPWKTCLLEGLQESRAKNKPVLLWVFIDRPADDARC